MTAILTYHSIDDSGSPISVSPESFARHVEFLASDAVTVGTVQEVEQADHEKSLVALTFDDGFSNFADVAWPRLRDAGLPATVFVVTDHVGRDNRWGGAVEAGIPGLPLMDWDTLGRLQSEGVALQCHSRSHPHLDRIDDPSRLEAETVGAADVMEDRLGVRPEGFCYPYGSWTTALAARCAEHFRWACTTRLAMLRGDDDPHGLPRLDAFYLRDPGRLEAYGTARFRRYISWRAFLRRLREAFGRRGEG